MDPGKTEAIVNLAPPKNLKHLVSFLQTCSWYRRFIEHFLEIAAPLTHLTKKKASWSWGNEQPEGIPRTKTEAYRGPNITTGR